VRAFKKKDFPPENVRRFLEPGPIVLVSSAHRNKRNIMTMGWHMIMEAEPSLVGCYIWDENDSYSMIRASKECVINVPTVDLVNTVIDIGNTHGRDVDKFEAFGLTAVEGVEVGAPRNHQGLANALITPCTVVESRNRTIDRRPRLGGILNY
jgi:flavin reductase (DIM6/NTAB) family NADH-FMN oxidoreductase RutF